MSHRRIQNHLAHVSYFTTSGMNPSVCLPTAQQYYEWQILLEFTLPLTFECLETQKIVVILFL
jgi:hypothetical protein